MSSTGLSRYCIIVPALIAALITLSVQNVCEAAEKKHVAVLSFKYENATVGEANAVRNIFEVSLHKTGAVRLVERDRIDAILDSQHLNSALCGESSCAVKIGRYLSVDKIVVGSVIKLNEFTITIKLVDVATGYIESADAENASTEKGLNSAATILARRLAGVLTGKNAGTGPSFRVIKTDISAYASCVVPFTRFERLARPGVETGITIRFFPVRVFFLSVLAGYSYLRPNTNYIDRCTMVPSRLGAGAEFMLTPIFCMGFSFNGGISYDSVFFNNKGIIRGHFSSRTWSIDPMGQADIFIGFLTGKFNMRFMISYQILLEKSQPLQAVTASIFAGARI